MIDNTSLIKKVKLKQKAKFSQINKKHNKIPRTKRRTNSSNKKY